MKETSHKQCRQGDDFLAAIFPHHLASPQIPSSYIASFVILNHPTKHFSSFILLISNLLTTLSFTGIMPCHPLNRCPYMKLVTSLQKQELIRLCTKFNLPTDGSVPDLRNRLKFTWTNTSKCSLEIQDIELYTQHAAGAIIHHVHPALLP